MDLFCCLYNEVTLAGAATDCACDAVADDHSIFVIVAGTAAAAAATDAAAAADAAPAA